MANGQPARPIQSAIDALFDKLREWVEELASALAPEPELIPVPIPVQVQEPRQRR